MFDLPSDLQAAINEAHQALTSLMAGDPELTRQTYWHTEHTTLFGAYGGHETGWPVISRRLDAITPISTGGSDLVVQPLAAHVSGELAYTVELEHRQIPADTDTLSKGETQTLRVTQVFLRDHGAWKIIHRHADPLSNVHSVLADAGWDEDRKEQS